MTRSQRNITPSMPYKVGSTTKELLERADDAGTNRIRRRLS